MAIDKSKLTSLIYAKGYKTQTAFASTLDMDASLFSLKINGHRDFTSSEIENLIILLGRDVLEALFPSVETYELTFGRK